MWVAKIQLSAKNALIGSKTLKHGVIVTGYPISSFSEKNRVLSVVAGLVFGDNKKKRGFVNDLKRDNSVLRFELKGDFIIALISQPKWTEVFYNPYIIHLRPAVIDEKGEGTYEFGSWDRKRLQEMIRILKKYREAKLLSFSRGKISNITLLGILPELTKQQKKALELAIINGYYNYPRKAGLAELAHQMSTSLSTFREHLRLAEKKVMPKIV